MRYDALGNGGAKWVEHIAENWSSTAVFSNVYEDVRFGCDPGQHYNTGRPD